MTDETTGAPAARARWAERRDDLALAFDFAPTSMWMQDLSLLKARLDAWQAAGMADLRARLAEEPSRVEELVSLVRLVTVNAETLRLYEVADEAELFSKVRDIFGEDQIASFVEVICQLWAGARRTSVVTTNYTARGAAFDVNYKGCLLPGHERDWARYLICVEDVTRQENALRALEAARVRDALTGLHNRAFLVDEMERLEAAPGEVALAVIDLNGLKAANDRFGHKAGDDLLRRMGHLLVDGLPPACRPVRMGGDEFVAILPGLARGEVEALFADLVRQAESEAGSAFEAPLSFSVGLAWRQPGESMDQLLARADREMYARKRAFHDRAA